jgi:uncharacterized OB-fold protein
MTLAVLQCTQCGTRLFPARYFCPSCGGHDWIERVVAYGTVSESTVVWHRASENAAHAVHLASVTTNEGPIVIARLEDPLQDGTRVRLDLDEVHRIVARPI